MKKALAIFFLLFAAVANAKDKKDYENYLSKATNSIENYANDKAYETYQFINKKTGEKKKFADFSEMDRLIFFVLRGNAIDHELEDTYYQWQEQLEKFDENSGMTKEELNSFLDKLFELRKRNAAKVENLVDKLFLKFPNEFTAEEKKYLTDSIREYHDKYNLVKRDK